MYSLVFLSVLGAAAATCPFTLTATGGKTGTIGSLGDGQTRIGGDLTPTTFSISSSNGTVTDDAGRACILTPSVEQFQCDLNGIPASGFSISSNGSFTASGSSVFYACPASETEWNLYTKPVAGQLKCVEVGLTASSCYSAESSSSSVVASTSASSIAVATPAPSVVTVTVHDCGAASAPVAESTAPAQVASSAPVVVASSAPAVAESSAPVVAASSAPVAASTPIAASAPVVAPSPAASTPVAKSSAPVVAPSPAASTPVAKSSAPVVVVPTTLITSTQAASSPKTTPVTIHSWSNATATSAIPAVASSANSCVATKLTGSSTSGNYQYPHLIVPVESTSPNTAYGTQYFATVSSNTSTIFNFDIPSSYSGKTCNLIFLLPEHDQLETSSYTSSGSGEIDFKQLSSVATSGTTYNNQPSVSKDLGDFKISVGSSTLVESFSCPAGETVSYELSAIGNTYLNFFEDWNPSPLGLFVTYC